jgi:hypothetical protein
MGKVKMGNSPQKNSIYTKNTAGIEHCTLKNCTFINAIPSLQDYERLDYHKTSKTIFCCPNGSDAL